MRNGTRGKLQTSKDSGRRKLAAREDESGRVLHLAQEDHARGEGSVCRAWEAVRGKITSECAGSGPPEGRESGRGKNPILVKLHTGR